MKKLIQKEDKISRILCVVLLQALMISWSAHAQSYSQDFGDGSNGACTEATFTTGGTYQCQSVVISNAVNVQGSSALIIRVQSTVQINATLSVNGSAGQAGGATGGGASSLGGAAGAGGNSGGNCALADNCGSNSLNDGRGTGGATGGTAGGVTDGGGGGGGGSFQTAGQNGQNGSSGASGGNGGSVYGSASALLETAQAASSGGAGGKGGNTFVDYTGAGGGGSGGILRIIAQGSITISATGSIRANGGNGGDSNSPGGNHGGGAGGGGAGGLIHLLSAGGVTNSGTLEARGGTGGAGPTTSGGGDGGNGGNGFILIQTPTGALSGTAPSSPTANFFTLEAIPLKAYAGDFKCGPVVRGSAPSEVNVSGLVFRLLALFLGFGILAVVARLENKTYRHTP